jgi:HK97 gp10 family phage protein
MSQVKVTSRIPQIIAKAQARQKAALRAVAEDVADKAKSRAPRSTGTLAESIQAEPEGDDYAVTAEWYWRLVEFGTRHSAAHPFATPAAQGAQAELTRRVGDLNE